MACKKCGSSRELQVQAKCDDRCAVSNVFTGEDLAGGVPAGLNIGEGDYVRLRFCMQCGTLAGKFPVADPQR
jgi:hypothetical protein